MRLFFAVLLDDHTRRRVALVQETMKRSLAGQRIAWVTEENLHLTLRFLGEQDEKGARCAIEAGHSVARQLSPFHFTVRGAGVFPDPRHARVLWVGVEEPAEPLYQLARHLENALRRQGFPPEDKPFRSHITLARIKEPLPTQVIRQLFSCLPDEPLGSVQVRSFVLMQSVLRPEGAVYTPVQEFVLR
ncbi:MAG: RNA 2',3'-cyclic phosphodiesterase [Armatimonadota bacterium]|nr:RNA 2',3'-cyclic phosphodiesterase [Armatimonadota bacterium]